MTSIAEAWSGAAFSQPLVNDVSPQPAAAAAAVGQASERDVRDLVRSYLRKQCMMFGAEGAAALLPRACVRGLRNMALLKFEYWSDVDVAVFLAVLAIIVVLIDS